MPSNIHINIYKTRHSFALPIIFLVVFLFRFYIYKLHTRNENDEHVNYARSDEQTHSTDFLPFCCVSLIYRLCMTFRLLLIFFLLLLLLFSINFYIKQINPLQFWLLKVTSFHLVRLVVLVDETHGSTFNVLKREFFFFEFQIMKIYYILQFIGLNWNMRKNINVLHQNIIHFYFFLADFTQKQWPRIFSSYNLQQVVGSSRNVSPMCWKL